MALVKLTLIGVSKTPIYINPDHIVSVVRFERHTSILTTSAGKDGEPKKYNVVEQPDVVAEKIIAQRVVPQAFDERAA